MQYDLLNPSTPFLQGEKPLDWTIGDFWSFMYSNLWDDMQDDLSEYIVSQALGILRPTNKDGWCLWDINYQGKKIEVKESSDWHCWNRDGYTQKAGVFNINKAYTKYKDPTSEFKRQSDIYVFCHLTGHDKESSNPMDLQHWEFFVVPTETINRVSGNAKTISLSRVRRLADCIPYEQLKEAIDKVVI